MKNSPFKRCASIRFPIIRNPASGERATPVNLHLMPLWWRSDRPEEVTVRALHDGKDIADSYGVA